MTEVMDDRDVIEASLRALLPAFIQRTVQTVAPNVDYQHNWHIDAIAWHLRQCMDGRIKRLIITVPPRHLKSICASVAFPAWLLGHDPRKRIICASYGSDLTAKHARDCRMVMDSAWYRRIFPRTRLNPKKNAELEFETTQQGVRFGTSLGGGLTGRGGNVVIIDDPIKPGDALSDVKRAAVKEWYDSTLYSRLDSKRDGVIIIVMQRVHIDDLVGHVLEKGDWVHLDLPAVAEEAQDIPLGPDEIYRRAVGEILHPEREDQQTLDGIRATMGSMLFNAQYQQRPVPAEGNLVRWSWFRTYRSPPTHQPGTRLYYSWDTASKAGELNDYSVGTFWLTVGAEAYLLDVIRVRLEYPFLKKIIQNAALDGPPCVVLIEDKGSGTQLIQDLKYERYRFPVIGIKPDTDKVTRMSSCSALIEAGKVHIPASAPWLDAFKAETLAFPHGKHDDQVDSVSQFLGWWHHARHNRVRQRRAIGLA